MSQTQINQMFQQKKNMSTELKRRYAQRLLQFPHVHNKEYLKSYAKTLRETKDSYISGFKESID